MLYLLASLALAAEGPGPLLAPSATPLPAGTAEISAGGIAVATQLDTYCLNGVGPSESSCGPSIGVYGGAALEARAVVAPGLQVHAAGAWMPDNGLLGGMVDIGYSAVNTEHVHLAPWVGVIGGAEGQIVATGLSFDAGGRRVTFDISTPLVAGSFNGGEFEFADPLLPLAATEAGVTFHFSDTQALRVGMESVMPGIGYRGRFGPVFVEARVHGFYSMLLAGSLETGVQF